MLFLSSSLVYDGGTLLAKDITVWRSDHELVPGSRYMSLAAYLRVCRMLAGCVVGWSCGGQPGGRDWGHSINSRETVKVLNDVLVSMLHARCGGG